MNSGNGSHDIKKRDLYDHTLDELLQDSLLSTPAVSVTTHNMVSEAAGLLSYHLETFTDSLVVTEDEKPVGTIGGYEFLKNFMQNPTSEFFENTRHKDIMYKNPLIVSPETKLSEIIKKWIEVRRAFAIIPNQYHGYSVISARKMLEIGISCRISIKLSDVPMKEIFTFSKDDTADRLIRSMIDNNVRKLVMENTSQFVNDRIIIQKIAREFEFLHKVDNFLDMKADIFRLNEARIVSDELTVWNACELMYYMHSPFLLIKDNIMTPWDLVMILSSGM